MSWVTKSGPFPMPICRYSSSTCTSMGSSLGMAGSFGLLRLLQLRQQRVVKVARRNRALADERQMERLERELVAEPLLRFVAQREDLILAEPVGDRLRRPLRI